MEQFLKRLDHLGIAVRDLAAAMATYGDSLGLTEWEIIDMPERSMQVAVGRVGDTLLELITPTSPAAAFSKFLDERGEGIHHIAYEVDNLAAVLAQLEASGVRLIDRTPRPGIHNTSIAFIHPKALVGVLTELVEHAR
ncbi:MAG: methylmalonyl-CoA epimerase [Herpetosiphonaceae bacterium]|nr:methylmalonyl-CoA epimerase [Herpetosiphonaceae bacterium]